MTRVHEIEELANGQFRVARTTTTTRLFRPSVVVTEYVDLDHTFCSWDERSICYKKCVGTYDKCRFVWGMFNKA